MPDPLVPGMLVSFNGEGEYEVLGLAQNGRAVEIQAEEGEALIVRYDPSLLVPVVRHPGDQVRSRVTDQLGIVQSRTNTDNGLTYYRVTFPDGRVRSVAETVLRGVPITDPLRLMAVGRVEQVRDFQLRVMAARLSLAHQYDALTTLSNTRLELKPHQVSVAHRVVEHPPHRFLLADEVGLGKTIEAGLILKELRAREVAKRVLIVAPANLTSQWQWEMRNKFNEVFSLYNAQSVAHQRERHPGDNVWTLENSVICSAQYVTAGDRVEHGGQRPSYAQVENLPPRMQEVLHADWDVVVVDEAHHARRSSRIPSKAETNIFYWFLSHLAQRTPSLLLLTATPMQLDPSELYWLLDLLDPALFPSQEDFERSRIAAARLNNLIGIVRDWDRPRVRSLSVADLTAVSRQITDYLNEGKAEDWDEGMVAASLLSPESRQPLLDLLMSGHRLSEVIIRNRKSVVGGFMPRRPEMIGVPLSAEELEAYNAVNSYVRDGYRQSKSLNNLALGFVMVTFQKLLSSSSYALRRALERRLERLADTAAHTSPAELYTADLDDEELDDAQTEQLIEEGLAAQGAGAAATETVVIQGLLNLLTRIPEDTKLAHLRKLLRSLPPTLENGTEVPTKVLVFSQFRQTIEYLARELGGEFICEVFHGSLQPNQKDAAAHHFREVDGAQVLLSTEAGGEGRNFQFCHVLVNYDLPWNPMRVEQRIGRLDRIGQKHPILIRNFALIGTVEERVVSVLTQRIRLFEETVGGIEPILGDVARDVRDLIMENGHKVEEFAVKLKRQVDHARTMDSQQADFVMDIRSFSQAEATHVIDNQAPLSYEHLRRWTRRALDIAGCRVDKLPSRENVYELRPRDEFRSRFRQFSLNSRLVTFNRARALSDEDLEFLAFGHPLVDGLTAAWLNDEFGGLTTSWVLQNPELPDFDGFLFHFIAEFSGRRRIRRLYAVAVHTSGEIESELGDQLSVCCGDYARPSEFPPSASRQDAVYACHDAAQVHLNRLMQEECARLSAHATRAYDQELSRQSRQFTHRRTVTEQKVRATEATLLSLQGRGAETKAVLPMWEAKLEQTSKILHDLDEQERLAREGLRNQRNVVAESTLLNVAAVRNRQPES